MSVLLVDAEEDSRTRIRSELRDRGVHVAVSTTVAEANAALAVRCFGAVIIEMTLPDGTALEVLDRLRASGSTSHVIVLGGPTCEGGRVGALERGADEFVVTPCDVGERAARVLAVRRHRDAVTHPMVQIGRLRIDLQSREVTSGGEKVELTAKEFDLLAFLAERPGIVFDREQLLNTVWRSGSEWQQATTVTEHIRRLRGKLEIDSAHPAILTNDPRGRLPIGHPDRMPVPQTEVGARDAAQHPGAPEPWGNLGA